MCQSIVYRGIPGDSHNDIYEGLLSENKTVVPNIFGRGTVSLRTLVTGTTEGLRVKKKS